MVALKANEGWADDGPFVELFSVESVVDDRGAKVDPDEDDCSEEKRDEDATSDESNSDDDDGCEEPSEGEGTPGNVVVELLIHHANLREPVIK